MFSSSTAYSREHDAVPSTMASPIIQNSHVRCGRTESKASRGGSSALFCFIWRRARETCAVSAKRAPSLASCDAARQCFWLFCDSSVVPRRDPTLLLQSDRQGSACSARTRCGPNHQTLGCEAAQLPFRAASNSLVSAALMQRGAGSSNQFLT